MNYIPPFNCKLHKNRSPGSSTVPTIAASFVTLAVASILAGLATPAGAGSLRGRVTLSGTVVRRIQAAHVNPYPGTLGSLDLAVDTHTAASNPSEVVIYLQGGRRGGDARRPNPKLYQINQNFVPRVLGVPVGATVEFPNKDHIFHNVFSYSKTKRFDLGYYGQNKSKNVRFDKPGLVKVFCDIHSNMAAFIYVVNTPFVTQPEPDGNYLLDEVPDGTYTLTVWHPQRGEKSQTITITESTHHDIEL